MVELKGFEKVYPLFIQKYESFIPSEENAGIVEKINSMIQYLSQIGRLSNDVLSNWNKVMKWLLEEGLSETIEKMVIDGQFDILFDTLVLEKVEVLETVLNNQLVVVNNKLIEMNEATEETIAISSYAKEQADYLMSKQTMIEYFTSEQTNLQKQLNDLVLASGGSDAETIQARGEYTVLNERLDESDSQLAQKVADLPLKYGAIGNGIANDTTAFTNLEVDIKGVAVNLNNKTYLVTTIPKKNSYYNGIFKVGTYERVSALSESYVTGVPKKHNFGGQLKKLKYSLANPLEQFTGIVFMTDSIGWGLGLPENNVSDPRDGTLSDPRDFYDSPSFVNNFKRYVGSRYLSNVTPVKTNWSASPSGEAITTFEKEIILHPDGGDFTSTTTGTVLSAGSVASSGSLTGFAFRYNIESSKTGEGKLSFNFTGDSFTLSIDSVVNSMGYELFVNGVSQGVFSTVPGEGGMVAGFDNRRTHTFPYVRNKLIEIKTVKNAYVGTQILKLGGIIIKKKIRITNQGIIGATAKSYREKNLTGNTSGDGVAFDQYDNYAFVQFGANDRLISSTYPKGSNEFKNNLKLLVDSLISNLDVVIMASNPVANESTSSYSFNMQQARNVVYRLASEKQIDMIDNYAIYEDISVNASVTSDGLHLNKFGAQVMSRNIINSVEMSD